MVCVVISKKLYLIIIDSNIIWFKILVTVTFNYIINGVNLNQRSHHVCGPYTAFYVFLVVSDDDFNHWEFRIQLLRFIFSFWSLFIVTIAKLESKSLTQFKFFLQCWVTVPLSSQFQSGPFDGSNS